LEELKDENSVSSSSSLYDEEEVPNERETVKMKLDFNNYE